MAVTDGKDLSASALQAYQSGDFKNAARLFGEAASVFLSNPVLDPGSSMKNKLDAAEMKNNQSVALLQAGDARGSYDAAHGTAQVFLEAGDFRRQGMAFGNEAAALNALGRLDEAIANYRLAADALEKAGEDQLRASSMQALAGIQLRKWKYMDALFSMQIGLAGLKHPTLRQKILLFLLRFRT